MTANENAQTRTTVTMSVCLANEVSQRSSYPGRGIPVVRIRSRYPAEDTEDCRKDIDAQQRADLVEERVSTPRDKTQRRCAPAATTATSRRRA